MRIHPEGFRIIPISIILLVLAGYGLFLLLPAGWNWLAIVLPIIPLVLVLNFFRNPVRRIPEISDSLVYAPADGQVVVIEKTTEPEYFGDERLQVSIFMSIFDVHANRMPVGGQIEKFVYHPGKYLIARHPKSSVENERTTVVVRNPRTEILFRQIAGYVARRIRSYIREGQSVAQGEEMGFIRFGSRVDIFLPLNSELEIQIGDHVKGNRDLIARIP